MSILSLFLQLGLGVFFYNTAAHPVINVSVGINHTCGSLISLTEEGLAHNTSFIPITFY